MKIDFVLMMTLFFAFNFLVGGLIAFFESGRLASYLKKHKYSLWNSQRMLSGYPADNPLKTVPYLFNKKDMKDKTISKLKKRIRFWIAYSMISSLLIIIWVVLVTIADW